MQSQVNIQFIHDVEKEQIRQALESASTDIMLHSVRLTEDRDIPLVDWTGTRVGTMYIRTDS